MDEYELVLEIQTGNDHAFRELLRRFEGMIEKACNQYYFPNADRDDVRQIGRLALWEAAVKFKPSPHDWYNPNKGFGLFARQVIHRKIISELKFETRKKRQGNDRPFDIDTIYDIAYEEDFIDWEPILRLFSELTKLEQKAMYLYIEGYDYKEMADILGTSRKSVDNAIQRGRRKATVILERQPA